MLSITQKFHQQNAHVYYVDLTEVLSNDTVIDCTEQKAKGHNVTKEDIFMESGLVEDTVKAKTIGYSSECQG